MYVHVTYIGYARHGVKPKEVSSQPYASVPRTGEWNRSRIGVESVEWGWNWTGTSPSPKPHLPTNHFHHQCVTTRRNNIILPTSSLHPLCWIILKPKCGLMRQLLRQTRQVKTHADADSARAHLPGLPGRPQGKPKGASEILNKTQYIGYGRSSTMVLQLESRRGESKTRVGNG
jgi:hypothetical protein